MEMEMEKGEGEGEGDGEWRVEEDWVSGEDVDALIRFFSKPWRSINIHLLI